MGESCAPAGLGSDCQAGLYCSVAGRCAVAPRLGEPCSTAPAGELPCPPLAYCAGGSAGICTSAPVAGEPCVPGLCWGSWCDDGALCRAYTPVGGACTQDAECEDGRCRGGSCGRTFAGE